MTCIWIQRAPLGCNRRVYSRGSVNHFCLPTLCQIPALYSTAEQLCLPFIGKSWTIWLYRQIRSTIFLVEGIYIELPGYLWMRSYYQQQTVTMDLFLIDYNATVAAVLQGISESLSWPILRPDTSTIIYSQTTGSWSRIGEAFWISYLMLNANSESKLSHIVAIDKQLYLPLIVLENWAIVQPK